MPRDQPFAVVLGRVPPKVRGFTYVQYVATVNRSILACDSSTVTVRPPPEVRLLMLLPEIKRPTNAKHQVLF